jgi:hypothetical protein
MVIDTKTDFRKQWNITIGIRTDQLWLKQVRLCLLFFMCLPWGITEN